jgi:hypothetical protein
MRQGLETTVASEWPSIKSALMDLVSNVIMHPENDMVWFAEWCREHRHTVNALAEFSEG